MEKYEYISLAEKRFIRVLKLKPGNSGDLCCDLIPVSLDKLPKYEALSYSWDSQELTGRISCHGKQLSVTPNCEAALRRLRLQWDSRLLWIDAICIDQSSVVERNQQVAHMGEIYTMAKRVVVWIGEGSPETLLAFQYFERVAVTGMLLRKDTQARMLDLQIKRFKEESKNLHEGNFTSLDGVLKDVFSRSWFSRLWTIQEVALARRIDVMCGSAKINFNHFAAGSRIVAQLQEGPDTESPLLGHGVLSGHIALHVRIMDSLKRYRDWKVKLAEFIFRYPKSESPKLSRSTILELGRDKMTSDPKDKIFGLYGLLSAMDFKLAQDIDYSKSLVQIYTDETVAALTEDNSLDIFYNITGSESVPGLPSWVPDWSDTTSPRCTTHWSFCAAGEDPPRFGIHRVDAKLLCRGRILDIVESVSNKIMPPAKGDKNWRFEDVIDAVQDWAAFCDPEFITEFRHVPQKYVTGELFSAESFCDILIRGGTILSDPYGELEATRDVYRRISTERVRQQETSAMCWFPIATAATTDVLYRRMSDYPESLVSDDILTGISLALAAHPLAKRYHQLVELMSQGLRMFKTEYGFLGTALPTIQKDDEVVLIAGLRMPFILRPLAGQEYRILGPAYVSGAMGGGWWKDCDPLKDQEFVLV
ncbi:heterokaryon incompatibility protein-domain-containing protein [Bisporella sp. PMI_857]|nr:heterokaryon incompatibility protein-domain-containing protein [Bisporella sp. PMI_857]